MVEISVINVHDLNKMCRLCLSTGVTLLDIFQFSTKMENRLADVIMTCAPVQIKKDDVMPSSICRSCCTQVEHIHQFQTQAVQSEKTLRRHLQQLHKEIKTESSEDLILDTKSTISTGCAFSNNDCCDINCENTTNNIRDDKVIEFIDVNRKEKDPAYLNSEKNVKEETTVNFEIKVEPIDAYFADGTVETSSKTCGAEIDGDPTWSNFEEDCPADKDGKKTTSVKKKANKVEYNCDYCNKCFPHPSSLSKHRRIHTGEKPFQCTVCNKHFSQSQHLKSHQRIHTGEKPYQCEVCCKCFTQPKYLSAHKLTHTGEKPYRCDVCNKCFSQLNKLVTHNLIHTGEKPHQCDVCNKQFSQSQHLKSHERIHTGEKPYRCEVCNKCFARAADVNIHKRTHTGEKPYQCDVCSKHFSQSQHLKTHKLRHTGEKPHRCDVCNKCFTRSTELNLHKRTHHNQK